jgi:ATP-dependent Lon protease
VIAAVARKAARRIAGAKTGVRPFTITPKSLPDLLGPPQYTTETAETIREFGVAIGLAWNPVGGDILFIEAARMPGNGKLLLTGSLGDVMKESAQTALTYLRGQSKLPDLDLRDFDKTDIHIHVPAGATPKDGPSAGITIVVALASLLTRRKVRSDVAMTGEISLRGRILPVGGVKEKVLAASRAGITRVILPEENRKDWVEIPQEVRGRLTGQFVRRIDEVFPLALRDR